MPFASLRPDQLEAADRQNVWHAFTQMRDYEPLIIQSAFGCTLVDVHGRQYLDGVSSLWCNVHGHRHPHLDAALKAQCDRVSHVTSLGMSNPATIQLAHELVRVSPEGLNHVFFSSDGACAVEVALKQAFQYWQQRSDPRPRKTKFVAYEQAYHGDTLGSVSVGGVPLFHGMFHPLLFDVLRLPSPDTYRIPKEAGEADAGSERLTAYYLEQLERLLEAHHEEIAALVIEPLVQGAAGMVMQPAGYLRGVRQLTRKYDVLLIADEVAVGFGRTGTLFACEQEAVEPDFLCLGKGLTGGYLPMAATLSTDEIWNAFLGAPSDYKSFYHGHTYSGNPLSAAVALASLEVFERERVLEQLPEKAAHLERRLQELAEHPHVGAIRQRGMLAAVEVVENRTSKQRFPAEQRRGAAICREALEHGVWLRPLGDVLVIMPPLSIQCYEIDRIVNAVQHGLKVLD